MALLENIKRDLKEAMKQGEKQRLSALRMILSNVKNRQIEKKERPSKTRRFSGSFRDSFDSPRMQSASFGGGIAPTLLQRKKPLSASVRPTFLNSWMRRL